MKRPGFLGNLFGGSSGTTGTIRHTSVRSSTSANGTCKAFQAGRCVVRGADTGPCDWNPSDWPRCNVVIETKKFYGQW